MQCKRQTLKIQLRNHWACALLLPPLGLFYHCHQRTKPSCVKNKFCADSGEQPAHVWPLFHWQRNVLFATLLSASKLERRYFPICSKRLRKRNEMSSKVPMGNGQHKNSQYFVILQKEKKRSWKQIRLIALIILKIIMILNIEKKSDTGFHHHMWKNIKGKLDEIAKAVWGQELPPYLSSPQSTRGGSREV